MKNKIKLTIEEVKHVGKLAKIDLTDQEINHFQKQLSEILDYVEILKEIPTDNIQPTSQVTSLENILRKDETEDSLTPEQVLSGTQKKQKDLFQIKRILDKD